MSHTPYTGPEEDRPGYDDSRERDAHEAEQFREQHPPCGCGDERCWLDPNDASNIRIGSQWFTADCVGLCSHCGEVDDLKALYRESYGRLRHLRACGDHCNEVKR